MRVYMALIQRLIFTPSVHIEMHANVLLAFNGMAILQGRKKTPLMKCFEENLIEAWAGCRFDEFDVGRAVCMDHETGGCHGLVRLFTQIIGEHG